MLASSCSSLGGVQNYRVEGSDLIYWAMGRQFLIFGNTDRSGSRQIAHRPNVKSRAEWESGRAPYLDSPQSLSG